MKRTGKLLAVEGPDGVGKSALTSGLVNRLKSQGMKCASCSFPGRKAGSLGELVYRVHHDALGEFNIGQMTELSRQVLHIAAHVDAIEREILPLLQGGTCVVLDRYWWSTLIYGLTAGASEEALRMGIALERLSWNGVKPAVVFLVDRRRPWRPEHDEVTFQSLREAYAGLADDEAATGQRVVKVDNEEPIEVAVATMMHEVGDNVHLAGGC